MVPLRDPPPRALRWQVAMAMAITNRPRPGTTRCAVLADQRRDDRRTGADYLALGHGPAAQSRLWRVPLLLGSPEYVHTVNVVRLTDAGEVVVTREPVLRDRG